MSDSSESGRRRQPRVLTNMRSLLACSGGPQWLAWPAHNEGVVARGRAVLRSFSCDYIFMDGLNRDMLMLALLKRLLPFYPPRLVLLNLLMMAPGGGRLQRARFRLLAWLLGGTWKIIQYHRDTRALQAHLRLPAHRFDYIPFKINQRELVERTAPSDGGYIFCGGKTRRDFETFITAVAALPYPVKIVTTSNEDIAEHGSFLADRLLPPHIEVVRLDGSARPFIELLAGARLVVQPIKPDICGVGIGVYILAMALRKCVVITAGPTTTEDLNEDLAVIVPPQDAVALREAIRRAYTDEALRSRLGENAYRYATALGGEERLLASIADWLQRDWRHSPDVGRWGETARGDSGTRSL
jgi:glycosyltransferase involved in cell wall biosynthesis